MFRFIFVAIFLILYLILSIPVFFVEWLIGKFNPHARDISSLRIVQWGLKYDFENDRCESYRDR